ncbi:MAG: hypothetical protein GX372_06595 [Ignavibacteria bacterium]|jgi:hypothetical protein|nr:hypothetical protein [Ignavibacteria bacterium]
MSVIQKTFKTKFTAQETKQIIEKFLRELPILNAVIDKLEWQGNKLCFMSKIGDGHVEVLDYMVNIFIKLNFAGSMIQSKIESTLDQEFLKLEEKNII